MVVGSDGWEWTRVDFMGDVKASSTSRSKGQLQLKFESLVPTKKYLFIKAHRAT